MANNCKEFVTAESDKPFFLYICTSDPHRGGGDATAAIATLEIIEDYQQSTLSLAEQLAVEEGQKALAEATATAAEAAANTARTLLPSTVTPGIPYPAARAATCPVDTVSEAGVPEA